MRVDLTKAEKQRALLAARNGGWEYLDLVNQVARRLKIRPSEALYKAVAEVGKSEYRKWLSYRVPVRPPLERSR